MHLCNLFVVNHFIYILPKMYILTLTEQLHTIWLQIFVKQYFHEFQ